MLRVGQLEAQPGGHGAKEPVGNLQQDARPVAGRFVGPGRPAVHEVQQHLLAVFDDGVVAASRDIDHRTDAAGIVFPLRIVQTLGLGRGGFHVVTTVPVSTEGAGDGAATATAGKDLPCLHPIIVTLGPLMSIEH